MAIDGTMFFGSPHHGIPYSAVQFGTIKNIIVIQDYNWNATQGFYEYKTWISKPTHASIQIIKKMKYAYKGYQRAESRKAAAGNKSQYVQINRSIPDWEEDFVEIIKRSPKMESHFADLERIPSAPNTGAFYEPPKEHISISKTKSMFKAQVKAMKNYSFAAIYSGLYLINSIRGYQPINWSAQNHKNNKLYSPRMINALATHVK